MSSQYFHKLLDECKIIHDKKNADYSNEQNPFSNFDFAASLTAIFKNPIDQVFACMIGIKIARLAELRNGKTPNNESVRDSHIDLTNYSGLWGAYHDNAKVIKEELRNQQEGTNYLSREIDELKKGTEEGIKSEFVIGLSEGVEIKYLQCTKCSFKTLAKKIYIEHAISMHSAHWKEYKCELIYPDASIVYVTI